MARTTRKRKDEFYSRHRDKGKLYTINHFKCESICASYVYKTLKKVEEGLSLSPKPKSGSERKTRRQPSAETPSAKAKKSFHT